MAELIECPVCKGKVSDEAPVCIHCGHPIRPLPTVDEPSQWETCIISWTPKMFLGRTTAVHKFQAVATSPKWGTYCAAESPFWVQTLMYRLTDAQRGAPPVGTEKHTSLMYHELVNRLLAVGWEPLARRGSAWWEEEFRRPADEGEPVLAPLLVSYSADFEGNVEEVPVGTEAGLKTVSDGRWIELEIKAGNSKRRAFIPLK